MNTDKKNQHYIPKFYLRNFSFENNQKQLGIFNLKSSFFFQKSKLKTQGSKNFFYGHDGKIEDSLSEIEGVLSNLIRNIIDTSRLPQKNSIEHLELLSFIGLTDLRNPTRIENIKNSRESVKKHLLELDPKVDINKFIPEIPHNYAVELALSNLKGVIDNISDLDFKLIVNKTDTPFISSDFPIVKYNQFLERKKWQHSKVGYGTIGLQIIFPINPNLGIIFFDPKIYKVGFKKNRYIEIKKKEDINSLNILQIVNCIETLYFNEKITENYIRNLVNKASKFKKANQTRSELSHILKEGENPVELNEKKKNLIIMGTTDCETKLEFEGLKIHSNSRQIKLSNSVAQLRDLPMALAKNNR
ncbi:DUF4238 domain-containing protein [bacterium AH-315-P13]|nr:DUF4238 domain-containing protein [bacterium AH-315-P13]